MNFTLEVHLNLHATFISLIPKKPEADDLKEFQPITLVGRVHKIVAKVLANRLKMVVENIISKPQCFQQG
jgi:hypothetical protein